jgi:hypothetical protein
MKNKLNDLIDYIDKNCVGYNKIIKKEAYPIIKDFIHEMCDNQKLICADSANTITDDYEVDDNGGIIWKQSIDRDSILDCKNLADEL